MGKNMDVRLKRPILETPEHVRNELTGRGLMDAYNRRPPYQRNDYIGWISRAKLPQTREKRLKQMLDELAAGDSYMGMKWRAKAVKNLADFLTPEYIRSTANPANIKLGEEIFKDGGVELIENTPSHVIAWVQPKGGARRTVEFRLTKNGLSHKCT
jgi:hypothetical protein